jgi:osmotically inducible protein OsmC
MAVISKAKATWSGSIKDGGGRMEFGNGAYHGEFTLASRFETGKGTNPEDLLAAAHAGCFSMQLSGVLTGAGTPPKAIHTTAEVTIKAGEGITGIALATEGEVPGIDAAAFKEAAEKARDICPVSKALKAVGNITVSAKLV